MKIVPPRFSPAKPLPYLFLIYGFLALCLLPSFLWALDVPPLTGRIVDRAHILPPTSLSDLNSALAAHESKTSNQVVVLTLTSLKGHPLEEFSHEVATTWSLGEKGTDNGVLFLIAVKEKKLRIEVGYGLEGTLTDAKSSRIIRHEVVPRFRTGNYSGGIVAGTHAILATIDGTYSNPSTPSPQLGIWEVLGFVLAVKIGTIAGLMLGAGRRLNGSIIGMIFSFLLALPLALGLGILASFFTFGLVNLLNNSGILSVRKRDKYVPVDFGPTSGPSGFLGGTLSGGFGGGFGGGGGNFGGGGASGGW